jgi:phosphoribosyl-AMP cyclohydrolase
MPGCPVRPYAIFGGAAHGKAGHDAEPLRLWPSLTTGHLRRRPWRRTDNLPSSGASHSPSQSTKSLAEQLDTVPLPEPPTQAVRPSALDPVIAARLRRNEAGLVAAIVREHGTGEVLMMAWMDDEALHRTLTTGRATYWSRSRQQYWVKGETSGHHQYVKAVALDCDGDTVLVTVEQVGAACHTGNHTCFFDELPVKAGAST